MSPPYWEYFLALEADLEKCTRYVDFSEANYGTYSVEFAKIIMTAASEFDTIAKELCKIINQQMPRQNIKDYRAVICTRYQNFFNLGIEITRYGLLVHPWREWTSADSPKWWKDYNKIKHDRTANFNSANLGNALLAVSALLIGILYFYDCKYGNAKPEINAFFSPRLLSPKDPNPSEFQGGGIFWDYTLP